MHVFLFCILLVSHLYLHSMNNKPIPQLTHFTQSLHNLEQLLQRQKSQENKKTREPINIIPTITLPPLYPKKITPATTMLQFKVLQQAYNANCGYHALKDTLYIIKALENDLFKKDLHLYLTNQEIYQEDYKEWSNIIAQTRKSKNTEWLDGQELEELYNNFTPEKPKETLLWTIDNLDWIASKYRYGGLIKTPGFDILKNFRNLETYQAGFLINNALEYTTKEGSQKTTSGHWFGVVVEKKDGLFFYYITDSLNRNRTKDDKVLLLKKFLEEDNIITIEIIVMLDPEMDSLKTSFIPRALQPNIQQKQHIMTALSKIKNIIDIAQKNNFLNKLEFNETRETLLDYLEQIEKTGKTGEEDLKLELEDGHITIEELRATLVNIN